MLEKVGGEWVSVGESGGVRMGWLLCGELIVIYSPTDFDPSSMFASMFGGFDGMGFGGMGGGRRGHHFSFSGGPEFMFQFS